MAQPIWITKPGLIGTIPEGVFYQNTMLVTVDALPFSPTCTATTAGTNIITCTSTTGIYAGLTVMFEGAVFGGIDPFLRYFVLNVVNATQFRITTTDISTSPVALTTGSGTMTPVFRQDIYYTLAAGQLPPGIQCSANGLITGVPQALASLQGVPFQVNRNVVSKFVLRAYTELADGSIDRIKEQTFQLIVTGNDVPDFATPAGSIGTFYDSDRVDFQFEIVGTDPGDTNLVTLAAGQLPGGLTISPTGFLSGYIQPALDVNKPPGYDLTASATAPYDFIVSSVNKNYEFTLQVSDGKSANQRTFYMYVYDRSDLTGDDTVFTADTTIITADETPYRRPFLINSMPSDLGKVRGDNYYAYQFRANDYDTSDLTYAIAVNQGSGFAPGLGLDPGSGWYYGFIPDQGVTEITYSFNVYARQTEVVGTDITCTATTAGTNIITCDSTSQLGPGTAVIFSGTIFGGVSSSGSTMYFVDTVVSSTEFTITANLMLNPDYPAELPVYIPDSTPIILTTASGSMSAQLVVASDPYPFTITVVGEVDTEVIWVTPANLGSIENGSTSILKIEAVNRGGRELSYRLKSGAYNLLPQGLELLPSGDIVGRTTFNTFAVDLGTTTFDKTQAVVLNTSIGETVFDTQFTFTVNAYAVDTGQPTYDVVDIAITNGGSGYSSVNQPTLQFSSPVGAAAQPAVAGEVTVNAGVITAVAVSDTGAGYTIPATLTITAGYGGSGAVLTPVMRLTGAVDVVSVFKTFTVIVDRVYNQPYQNLSVQAMPPLNDRVLVASLLDNDTIFIPEYIYRPDDPNFGKSRSIIYQHAYGLAPDILDTYVSSLYENHYWKNLVLGEIATAQATDDLGNVIYEVVYSRIIDDLNNAAGQSVSKIVALPYPIVDPADGSSEITVVYPNSLQNMRNQVIDVVGQISTKLPLWMTSKQASGRVLGFTPAWVICYTQPNRSKQIAYYIQTQFGVQLNRVDFKVDRYILDSTLSKNWDTTTQDWTPKPSLTTFDRYATLDLQNLGTVTYATRLAFADVNAQSIDYINSLGGLDGIINSTLINGGTLIFAKQEAYDDYATTDDAWQYYTATYDSGSYSPETSGSGYDAATTVAGGSTVACTATSSSTDSITCTSTAEMTAGDAIWFTGDDLSGLVSGTTDAMTGIITAFNILSVVDGTHFTLEDPSNPGSVYPLSTASGSMGAGFNNQRMGIWNISVSSDSIVSLTLAQQTGQDQYVAVLQGTQYRGTQLYFAGSPPAGLTRVTWTTVSEGSSTQTIFDEGSVAWIEPVDMYDPTDTYDKYLVFPKINILV
jgi:hypothetical protein